MIFFFSHGITQRLAAGDSTKTYVGSTACKNCHENEFNNFMAYSKKSHSFSAIAKRKTLTEQEKKNCFECHTTGYGKPGGFKSLEETPELKDTGCEVCHGPGSLHAQTGDPRLIIEKITLKDCETCHDETRVSSFKFKPLIYGGVH